MDDAGRIWKATIQPNSTIVPEPSCSSEDHSRNVYTTTSLAANTNLTRLNQEILRASEAYNNTPKPFTRGGDGSLTNHKLSTGDSLQVNLSRQNSEQSKRNIPLEGGPQICTSNQITRNRSEEMAPKLVHNQYNSPIDLYSMNNIRKTIEAQSELIAPGVKGINFMKPEMPVNKQSEVYKLVKEEEQKRNLARPPPMSSQQHEPQRASASNSRQSAEHYEQGRTCQQRHEESDLRYCQTAMPEESGTSASSRMVTGLPRCCECGQQIIGPFAKIQNRFVHPHCFNCTTCGTTLKNIGYFTINDKLYCEIHAKQVARVMRLQYDFDDRNHQLQSRSETQQPQQQPGPTCVGHCDARGQNQSQGISRTATISTMFASNAENHGHASGGQGTHWSWGQTGSGDRMFAVESTGQQPSRALIAQEQNSHSSSNSAQFTQQWNRQSFNRLQGHSLNSNDGPPVGARTPICVHCHTRIQGPYVLAGKTTWCKSCSQNNFQCSSCSRSLLDTGFIEDSSHKYYCEHCFEAYYAPICSKCNIRIKGDCLNALDKQWHPSCFVCGHCHRPFGNSSFYLEDRVPYCERDWNALFTTKCFSCSQPIEAGDKWIEALNQNYHSKCFKCTSCQSNLEGSTFYCKSGKPYCRLHAR